LGTPRWRPVHGGGKGTDQDGKTVDAHEQIVHGQVKGQIEGKLSIQPAEKLQKFLRRALHSPITVPSRTFEW
jgi:hypothetical protein